MQPQQRKNLKNNFEETVKYFEDSAAVSIDAYNRLKSELKDGGKKKVTIVDMGTKIPYSREAKITELNDEDSYNGTTLVDHKRLKNEYRKRFLKEPLKGKSFSNEELCRSVFENVYGKSFPRVRPDILSNPLTNHSTNLELDGYNEELQMAFEYNGEQHYNSDHYLWKKEKDFLDLVLRDKIKKNLCEENGIWLIVIPYTVEPKNIRKFIIDHLPTW